MLLILKREQVEFARLRVLAQAMINKDKGPEAFDEFRKMAFPWVETQRGRDREQHIKILQAEVKRGVLGIQPLWENTKQVRSRLRTKVVEASNDNAPRATRSTPAEKRIYQKMGALVPR
jgi:hypothetical protein